MTTQDVRFFRLPKLYEMFRSRYAIVYRNDKTYILENRNAMSVAVLIDEYHLLRDRDQIFKEMVSPAFDPRRTVILETMPTPAPVKSKYKGVVKVTAGSTDHLIIEADLPSPKILLITNSYSRGWRVRPLSPSTQKSYNVLPANYVLQAIPLEAGKHLFALEYSPVAFRPGKWISIIAMALYVCILVWYLNRRRKLKNTKEFSGGGDKGQTMVGCF